MLSDYLQSNLNFLKHHIGVFDFVNKLLKVYNSQNYIINEAKNGEMTLGVKDSSGRLLNYHSKYNPSYEANQIVDNLYEKESHAVILGFGLGYTTESILKRLPNKGFGKQLFIIEPDPFVFITALKYRDLSELLTDNRVEIYLGNDVDVVGENWNSDLDWSIVDGLVIIEHQPTKTRFNQFFSKLMEKMRYLANRSRGNLITLMGVGDEFQRNNFINLPEAFGLPGAKRLFDKFINIPAVIVAAGPSLDKNLDELKRIKGKFLIIAVDTAYRHMLANGIKPDIVCAADSSYENSLDFVGVEDEKEVLLVGELMTHPDIYKIFKGPKIITTFGGGLYPQIKNYREPFGKLVCWGSVATMAFDLARKTGANPIIFIGFDLSFSDGKLHTKGSYSEDILYENLHSFTSLENETASYICERGRFQFLDDNGKVVYTDNNMKSYKNWFEDQFKNTESEIINATEGGIVNKYVVKMTLSDTIDKYFDKGRNISNLLNKALISPVEVDYQALYIFLSSMKELIVGFEKNISLVKPICITLKERVADKLIKEIKGKDYEEFVLVIGLHDKICENSSIIQWFAALNAKFVTKHTSEVLRLRNKTDVIVGQWLDIAKGLFLAYENFANFQLKLLDKAMFDLSEKCVKINNVIGKK